MPPPTAPVFERFESRREFRSPGKATTNSNVGVSASTGGFSWPCEIHPELVRRKQFHYSISYPYKGEPLHHLAATKHFLKLTITSVCHQVKLARESRELTTFMTRDGRLRSRRVCLGLAFVPAAFKRKMTLDGCKGMLCCLDDMIIFDK